MGVAVGEGVSGIGVPVGIGSGVGVGSGSLIVRAKMLRDSTWAVAVEAVKSTVVGNGVHAPS